MGKVLSSSHKITIHPLAGHYDKILKENIADIFLPLAEKFLGIHMTRPGVYDKNILSRKGAIVILTYFTFYFAALREKLKN